MEQLEPVSIELKLFEVHKPEWDQFTNQFEILARRKQPFGTSDCVEVQPAFAQCVSISQEQPAWTQQQQQHIRGHPQMAPSSS
jgi:hypothetical protein